MLKGIPWLLPKFLENLAENKHELARLQEAFDLKGILAIVNSLKEDQFWERHR